MSGMRARGWRRQGGIMSVTLCVRPGEAQVLEARRGPRAAPDFLADVLAGLPEQRSVLLTDPASAPWLVRVALAAGDREQAARIVTAIGEVARGSPTLAFIRASAEHAGWASLTDIEQATARLVAEGLTNQRIADQLFISTHTVAFHLRQMFRKLDIRSRVDLARIALEQARPGAARTP